MRTTTTKRNERKLAGEKDHKKSEVDFKTVTP
jgi:hypothetical protein